MCRSIRLDPLDLLLPDPKGGPVAEERLHLGDRLALRPREAARALGLAERTLRRLLPRIPHIRLEGAVLIPTKALEQWLRDQASAPIDRDAEIAEKFSSTIQHSLRSSNKS